ncbi:LapA family protein [Clostridium sp. D2Q-11]|uniref:LapA family protein n=1 Tax=Anaeromonas frigoriresistens TaxID=2683708 RepID=A0A942UV69_9FIRM|nr:LapA family protein [Anaeromonas frigoriresistens]MBS4539688.1 LapA family protein [Anaeromonas frigoriresistens]
MQLGFIVSLLFAILITVFALQNSDVVNINFLFTNIPVSQALVIFISAAFGAIIVTILGLFRQLKLTKKIKDQKHEISKLKEENTKLQEINSIAESPVETLENDTKDDILVNEENTENISAENLDNKKNDNLS